jgi:hypothetical protein
MALLYLVKKPQVYGRIAQWLLLFLECDFLMIYKLEKSHSMVDALFHLLASNESSGVLNQIINVTLFLLKLVMGNS